MIPMLLYVLLKKMRKQQKDGSVNINSLFMNSFIKKMICLALVLIISSILMHACCQQLNYKVVRNGNEIGWLKLERSCDGNYCSMTLNSEVKFRILVLIRAYVFETSYFLNGKLVFSSQYHKTNGDIKVNKKTKFAGNYYEVSNDNEKTKIDVPEIRCNLLSLYFQEPLSFTKVYCDKQECFADIEKTSDGGYKVSFPNGDSNCYYYNAGLCNKVKIEHTFYSAEIILKP